MILGPLESYDLLLRMGKLPPQTSPEKRHRIEGSGLLLPLPQLTSSQHLLLREKLCVSKETIATLDELGISKSKYTVIVGDRSLRQRNKRIDCVVLSTPLPECSVLHVKGGVCILSPALCLLMLSRDLNISDVELVFAASQLCARYAYDNSPAHDLIERIPHTTTGRIMRYLDMTSTLCAGKKSRGQGRLEGLLAFVHDGARSPREIFADMMMGMSACYGSLHIPTYETNKVIELTRQEQTELDKKYLESDFVWESQRLILEYNGGVHEDKREPDSARTNVLRDKGYVVEILTKRVLNNFDSYMKFMRRFEDPLDCSICRNANELAQQRALHAQLLELANNQGRFSRNR